MANWQEAPQEFKALYPDGRVDVSELLAPAGHGLENVSAAMEKLHSFGATFYASNRLRKLPPPKRKELAKRFKIEFMPDAKSNRKEQDACAVLGNVMKLRSTKKKEP